jgi:hypothetical protein
MVRFEKIENAMPADVYAFWIQLANDKKINLAEKKERISNALRLLTCEIESGVIENTPAKQSEIKLLKLLLN